MKKAIVSLLTLVVSLSVPSFLLAEELTIVGTGDGIKILKAVGEAFSRSNPGITVAVPKSIGSGGGIKAVGRGQNRIGRVARSIKDKEKPYGLSYIPYAKSSVVFFVNKEVRVKNLSADQVCGIFSGNITNWKDVGGKDARIRVVRREYGDSSLKVLRDSFPGFENITITSKSKTAVSTPETIYIVEQKSNTIGFGPYDVAKDAEVNICSINGKNPANPNYLSFCTLALIYKQENLNGSIKKLVEFVTSSAAHEAIINAGGLPY